MVVSGTRICARHPLHDGRVEQLHQPPHLRGLLLLRDHGHQHKTEYQVQFEKMFLIVRKTLFKTCSLTLQKVLKVFKEIMKITSDRAHHSGRYGLFVENGHYGMSQSIWP